MVITRCYGWNRSGRPSHLCHRHFSFELPSTIDTQPYDLYRTPLLLNVLVRSPYAWWFLSSCAQTQFGLRTKIRPIARAAPLLDPVITFQRPCTMKLTVWSNVRFVSVHNIINVHKSPKWIAPNIIYVYEQRVVYCMIWYENPPSTPNIPTPLYHKVSSKNYC